MCRNICDISIKLSIFIDNYYHYFINILSSVIKSVSRIISGFICAHIHRTIKSTSDYINNKYKYLAFQRNKLLTIII